jgi:hypothetical protein
MRYTCIILVLMFFFASANFLTQTRGLEHLNNERTFGFAKIPLQVLYAFKLSLYLYLVQ